MRRLLSKFHLQIPALLSACLMAGQAVAHPHVWADMRSQLIVSDEGLITGVRVQWTTDPAYARDALDGFTPLADGTYSAADMQSLTDENLSALADYGYFIYFRFNGEKQKIGKASNGQQIFNPKDKRLTLLFDVPLETPLDPRKGMVSFKVYDPEYFIDFEYLADKPLLYSKPLPESCKAVLLPVPNDSQIEQTRLMLSTKDRAWKPDEAEDFGGMFAQDAQVKCGS